MTKVIAILLLVVFQYSTASPWEAGGDSGASSNECQEGESLLSRDDLETFISFILSTTANPEKFKESFRRQAIEMNNKYLENLNNYQEFIESQPEHIKHLLDQIESDRLNLEPVIKKIAAKNNEVAAYEEQLTRAHHRFEKLLYMIDAYVTICELNSENQEFVRRSLQELDMSGHISSKGTCGSIKTLRSIISRQVNQFQTEYIKEISDSIQMREKFYHDAVAAYNNNLKKNAMIQNKMVMYDILALQDGYIHFKSSLKNLNMTEMLDQIKNNIEVINQQLTELEVNVHEFGQYCLNNNNQIRSRPGALVPKILGIRKTAKLNDNKYDIVNQLVQVKIQDIRKEVEKNITDTFKEIDERLNNPHIINSNLEKLVPKQEDLDAIKEAQKGLSELKDAVAQSSIHKTQELLILSQEILEDLEVLKQLVLPAEITV